MKASEQNAWQKTLAV